MFFFLSKTLNYLTMPLVIICLLLLAGLMIKSAQWKRRLYKTGLVLLLFFSNDFLSNEVVRIWELPATPYAAIPRTYAVGILLTGVTKGNMTPDDRIYFQRGADRVTHSLQLYKLGIIKKIVVSGGSGMLTERTRKEADEISDALLLMGVPAQDILIENQSRNTHESAQAVKHLLEGTYTPDDCLLITSAFHMRRSRACFKKVDWPTATFSVDFLHHERKFTPDVLFVPKIEALHIWSTLIREWVGMIAYKVSGYI
jgi:uncharacterized SAM-binding protein YcdF (DUF218 family)